MTQQRFELKGELAELVRQAQRVVVLTGAGVSQESGLRTFRGAGGLWEKQRPEKLATPEAFYRTPDLVWQWYAWRHASLAEAQPNAGHLALARWQELFPSFLLVTQNVDNLHQRAGNTDVVALHGSLSEAYCDTCGRRRPMAEAIAESSAVPPPCASCAAAGGRFRPAVVWFGEGLPPQALARAAEAAAACDLIVAAGTSAQVYPAAGLIQTALEAGACFIEVNPEPTPYSHLAHLRLSGKAGLALPALTDAIAACRGR